MTARVSDGNPVYRLSDADRREAISRRVKGSNRWHLHFPGELRGEVTRGSYPRTGRPLPASWAGGEQNRVDPPHEGESPLLASRSAAAAQRVGAAERGREG